MFKWNGLQLYKTQMNLRSQIEWRLIRTLFFTCLSEPTQEELKERLRRAESEEEKEALMQEYSQKMAKAQDDIEQQKQKKLRDVRKLLKEERLRRKKELYKYVFQQRSTLSRLSFTYFYRQSKNLKPSYSIINNTTWKYCLIALF